MLEYKKDKDGKTVVTKLDEQSLAALAQATQGIYIKYTTPAQVAAKVEESVRDLDRSRSAASSRPTLQKPLPNPAAAGGAVSGPVAGFAF